MYTQFCCFCGLLSWNLPLLLGQAILNHVYEKQCLFFSKFCNSSSCPLHLCTIFFIFFNVFHPKVLQHINTNVSVNNTTIYFIYNKNSILSGQHVSTFTGSSSGPLRNRSKNYLYFNALRDPKCLQIILQECKIHEFVYIRIYVTVLALKC